MSERVPASLAYLLIYNPTLPPPDTSTDDEDAQEEAHILFYTSRERVVSRDRMLRQVGLAKALVNFSEIFTPRGGCDNVHSQGKRMISVSPEPDFWMHACVDLAKTLKEGKHKSKNASDPSPATCYYHEESLHDLALRGYLLRGYEEFKLLHGTYTMLKDNNPGTLELLLEHFFTPWAWRWDLEAIHEFGAHLGLPLHPLNSSLAPLFTSFIKDLPSNNTPILLSPPYVIEPFQPLIAPYPPSLLSYFLSLASPPGPPVPQPKANEEVGSAKTPRTTSYHGSANVHTPNNTFSFFNVAGVGMGEVMKVKKWSWPGVLTFGRTMLTSQDKIHHRTETDEYGSRNGSSTRETTTPLGTDKQEENVQATQGVRTHVECDVDQSSLDDAILNLNLPPQSMKTLTSTEANSPPENKVVPSMGTQQADSSTSNPFTDLTSPSLYNPLPPPRHDFSVLTVFISDPSNPLMVEKRRVLHISSFRLVFALIMDVGWMTDVVDESLQILVLAFLDRIQRAIDSSSAQYVASSGNVFLRRGCNTSAPPHLSNGISRSKHIIQSSRYLISSCTEFSTTSSSLLFESQNALTRDQDVIEMFSRSTNPQHWFVASRGLGFNSVGNKIQGEAYLQSSNQEASLVDADNELVKVVRGWADRES